MRRKLSVWWPEDKNSLNVARACCKRQLKWVPSAWGYSCVTLSQGVTNTEAWSSRWGLGMRLTAPPCKNPVVRKSKEELASDFDFWGRLWLIKGCHAKLMMKMRQKHGYFLHVPWCFLQVCHFSCHISPLTQYFLSELPVFDVWN
jgi:hypothetical protein